MTPQDTPELRCPHCEQTLSATGPTDRAMAWCDQHCHGVLLAQKTFRALPSLLPTLLALPVGQAQSEPPPLHPLQAPLSCPWDTGPMVPFEWNSGSDIWVHQCQRCQALWLLAPYWQHLLAYWQQHDQPGKKADGLLQWKTAQTLSEREYDQMLAGVVKHVGKRQPGPIRWLIQTCLKWLIR